MSDNLFLHYQGYVPPTLENREAERERQYQERLGRQEQMKAEQQAKREAKKAAKHQANLEAFRDKIRNSGWPEAEIESLIKKSYLW